MRVITGTVVGGKIELPAESIEEGAQVMVLAPEAGAPVQLSQAEEEELTEAMEQIHRGEYVEAGDLLNDLRSRIRAWGTASELVGCSGRFPAQTLRPAT